MPDEFDDLNLPLDDFDSLPSEDMPDPTDQEALPDQSEVAPAPKKGKAKKSKKEAAPKAKKEKAPKPPRAAGGPKVGLLASLVRADFYTVMLAIALVAVLISIFCLVMEWGSYGFERNARVSLLTPRLSSPATVEMSSSIAPCPPTATLVG